jgi:hypothetical protein
MWVLPLKKTTKLALKEKKTGFGNGRKRTFKMGTT